MDDCVEQVQKNVISFCRCLEIHVEKWRTILQESARPVEALCNQADQVRHVEKAKLKNLEGFEEMQKTLLFNILTVSEEEISTIKKLIEQLNKANQELKNKLSTLEQSTLLLDWEEDNILIGGSATQPKLSRLLSEGLEFWLFFKRAFQNINENFKSLDLRNIKAMDIFEQSFKVDVNDKVVTNFVAITQYVDNEKAIT